MCGHRWVAKQEGLAVALVLGALDFLDRARGKAGEPVATRARIQVELEGFLGRDAIDKALRRLVELTWVSRHERREIGRANLVNVVEFSLIADAVIPDVRNSGRRESGIPDGIPGGTPSPVYTKEEKSNTTTSRLTGTTKIEGFTPEELFYFFLEEAKKKKKENPEDWAEAAVRRTFEQGKLDLSTKEKIDRAGRTVNTGTFQIADRLPFDPFAADTGSKTYGLQGRAPALVG